MTSDETPPDLHAYRRQAVAAWGSMFGIDSNNHHLDRLVETMDHFGLRDFGTMLLAYLMSEPPLREGPDREDRERWIAADHCVKVAVHLLLRADDLRPRRVGDSALEEALGNVMLWREDWSLPPATST